MAISTRGKMQSKQTDDSSADVSTEHDATPILQEIEQNARASSKNYFRSKSTNKPVRPNVEDTRDTPSPDEETKDMEVAQEDEDFEEEQDQRTF